MLSGVDQLRLMSNILASIDKLTEVPPVEESSDSSTSHGDTQPNTNQGARESPS